MKTTEKTLTLDEMRRLVTANGTGWEWQTPSRQRGFITTSEGRWQWDDEQDCYVIVKPCN